MRRAGLFLVLLGLAVMVIGLAFGAGAFFSWNGRHPLAVHPLTIGAPLRTSFPAKAGTRYSVAVQVVFERDALAHDEGRPVVAAKLPLMASIEDASGVAVARVVGFIDPAEPPTVFYGAPGSAARARRGPVPEIAAERLVGALTAAVDRSVTFNVDLGADRVGVAPIKEARAIVFDDVKPVAMKVGLAGAIVGALALAAGAALALAHLLASPRGGIRRRQQV